MESRPVDEFAPCFGAITCCILARCCAATSRKPLAVRSGAAAVRDWDLWLRAAARCDVGYIAERYMYIRLHRASMQAKGMPPAAQAAQNVRTLEKAYAALAPDAPEDLLQMRPRAMQHALLQTAWFDLHTGRRLRAWRDLATPFRRDQGSSPIVNSGDTRPDSAA